jgi:hypothetical protein
VINRPRSRPLQGAGPTAAPASADPARESLEDLVYRPALAGSIGEALATTALGLMVAIPAVWIYNYFTAQQDRMTTRIGNAASQMLDEFIRRESRS